MVDLSLTKQERRKLITDYFGTFIKDIVKRWDDLKGKHPGLQHFLSPNGFGNFQTQYKIELENWRQNSGFLTENPLQEILQNECKNIRVAVSDFDCLDAWLVLLGADYDLMCAIVDFVNTNTTGGINPYASNKSQRDEVLTAFNYRSFRSSCAGKKFLYQMINDTLHLNACPYCNRQWVTVLSTRYKNGDFIIYPQIDHYFPKDIYPYLSRCIFNLIPSCSDCNHEKSNKNTYPHASQPCLLWYPYEPEKTGHLWFSLEQLSSSDCTSNGKKGVVNTLTVMGHSMRLSLKGTEPMLQNEKTVLHLEDRYLSHLDYVKDIYRNHMFYNQAYQALLLNAMKTKTDSNQSSSCITQAEISDVVDYWYMQPMTPDGGRRRPLNKLTQDIVHQLDDPDWITNQTDNDLSWNP